jgi:hypothetical protein
MAGPAEANLPERRDVSPGWVTAMGAALAGLLAVSFAVLWLVFGAWSSGPAVGRKLPDPAGDLASFRANEQQELASLGWIDRQAGIARIPVADAMALIARAGRLPDWSAQTPVSAECKLLESNVPRNPAAADCRRGWQVFMRPRP